MKQVIKKIKVLMPQAIILAIFVLIPNSCLAQGVNTAMEGMNLTAGHGFGGGDLDRAGIADDVPSMIGLILGTLLSFVGILFFLLMIYGGITWMIARGNEQEVEKAKNLIQAAVIGLIIVMSAYAITQFVGTELTAVNE